MGSNGEWEERKRVLLSVLDCLGLWFFFPLPGLKNVKPLEQLTKEVADFPSCNTFK